jgi:hypothetical protein
LAKVGFDVLAFSSGSFLLVVDKSQHIANIKTAFLTAGDDVGLDDEVTNGSLR